MQEELKLKYSNENFSQLDNLPSIPTIDLDAITNQTESTNPNVNKSQKSENKAAIMQ